jgi:hypothetical protein
MKNGIIRFPIITRFDTSLADKPWRWAWEIINRDLIEATKRNSDGLSITIPI